MLAYLKYRIHSQFLTQSYFLHSSRNLRIQILVLKILISSLKKQIVPITYLSKPKKIYYMYVEIIINRNKIIIIKNKTKHDFNV